MCLDVFQLIGLVRALRSTLPEDNISINAVAPAVKMSLQLQDFVNPFIAKALPVSSAHSVGLAIVYSAVASQKERVEAYGEDLGMGFRKRNGIKILTMGEDYTELKEAVLRLRVEWFGAKNLQSISMQQYSTDSRKSWSENE